jgi:hypothetical protein
LEVKRPRLASWNSNTNREKIEVNAYLDEVVDALSPLPESDPLYLHMDIDVERSEHLLRHHDLDNYLSPLFEGGRLPPACFVHVSARKKVGGGSRILYGVAHPSSEEDVNTWQYFPMNVGSGPKLQERLFEGLKVANLPSVPSGRAAVRLAWRCSATSRNWSKLWKGTIDTIGPVLGFSLPGKRFAPFDDRITDLEMHLIADETIGHDVIVGMWWRSA